MLLPLLIAAVLDPRTASVAAALLHGDPELASRLVAICERESGCRAIGVHRCDAHRSRAAWSDAVANMRSLDPEACGWHALDAGPWSTSGPWGAMRAYSLPHLGCWPAWSLDIPIVGAIAAIRRMRSPRCARVWGCSRWAGWSRLPSEA